MISAMMGGILPYHKILRTSKEEFVEDVKYLIDDNKKNEMVLLDCMKTAEYEDFVTSKNI
jgi:hypothetical protein